VTAEGFDPLPVAVRVFAVPSTVENEQSETRKVTRKRREPQRSLVFDTETTIDASQRLSFGVWRYYVDRRTGLPGQHCVEEGIFYADDLPERNPEGFAVLLRYVEIHAADVAPGRDTRLQLLSRSEFVEKAIWRKAHEHRATVVGFNLPFDLSRLAISSSETRRRKGRTTMVGGHSLRLFENERFRLRVDWKSVDSKRTLMSFTTAHGATDPTRGHFLDLRTLSFALTDRGHSLESACGAFGVPYEKRPVVHGTITEDYVTYCREDVQATAKLYTAAVAEYRRHPID